MLIHKYNYNLKPMQPRTIYWKHVIFCIMAVVPHYWKTVTLFQHLRCNKSICQKHLFHISKHKQND